MKSKPSRIIFGYREKNYKFVNFFVDKNDNSFYFHIYRKSNEFPMKQKSSTNTEDTNRIHFPSFEPTGFAENKISFHESGYIHSTDRKDNRYKDGVKGIPFDQVESLLFILALAPKNPAGMVELQKLDTTRDIHIRLPDNIEPFVLHFAVYKIGYELTKTPLPNYVLNGCIGCKYDDKGLGLLICMDKVGKSQELSKVDWPPFTVVLKRIG